MATTLQLTDGTNTVDLNDGTAFAPIQDGFAAPVPSLKAAFAGAFNPHVAGASLRTGADFIHHNRIVSLRLNVIATTPDALAANVQLLEAQLRRAQEFSAFGWGAQTQLKLQWGSATNPVYFNVITGSFDPIGAGSHNVSLVRDKHLLRRSLDLVCQPYAVGVAETIENWLDDADFEVDGTPLADWTASSDASGSDDQDTTRGPLTTRSLKLDVTDSTSGGQKQSRYQEQAAAPAETWSVAGWLEASDITASIIGVLHMQYRDASNALLEAEDWLDTANPGTFEQMKLDGLVAPTGTTTIRYWLEARATDANADGTFYAGQCIAVKASTAPVAWASGREIANTLDDDSQAEINYLDIEDIPGDLPAALQIFATEQEAHTKVWAGARHAALQRDAGLWNEGEGFTGPATVSDAGSSDANYGVVDLWPTFDAAGSDDPGSVTTSTISFTCATRSNRILIVSARSWTTLRAHSSVTYNGVSMTQIPGTEAVAPLVRTTHWYLIAPTADGSAHDIVLTMDGAADVVVGAVSYYGVNQTTPFGTATTDVAVTPAPAAVTTIVGGLAIGVISGNFSGGGGGNEAPGSGETERVDVKRSPNNIQIQDKRATSTSTTITWAATGAGTAYNAVAIPMNPASESVSTPLVVTKAIATPPVGTYRVLARINEQGTTPDVRVGIGYAYGAITQTPSVAAEYQSVAGSTFYLQDMGTINVPPVETPVGATLGSYTIRIAVYSADATNFDDSLQFDWLMLLPVDFGSAYASKTAETDVVLIDSRSPLRALALLDTSNVLQSFPASQGGDPPEAHPDGTRVYMHSDDGGGATITDSFHVSITYLPRYLSVAGA